MEAWHLKLVHSGLTSAWGEAGGGPQERGWQERSGPYLARTVSV